MIAILGLFALASACEMHKCGPLPADTCRLPTPTATLYALCPAFKPFCQIDKEGKGSCGPRRPQYLLPGDLCQDSEDCLSQRCEEGVCVGKQKGGHCSTMLDCEIGLYCAKKTCQPLISSQEERTECETPLDCDVHSSCFDGKCVRYFSQDIGEQTDCSLLHFSFLCNSGLCADNVCVSPPSHSTIYPSRCEVDSDCSLTECESFVSSGKCTCGGSSSGHKYCAVRPTDDVSAEYVNLARAWVLGREVENCHTAGRFQFRCLERFWDEGLTKRLKYLSAVKRPRPFQDLEPCALEVLLSSSLGPSSVF